MPTLEGSVEVTFLISAQGAVISAGATGIGDIELEKCVASEIRGLTFPAPKRGELVRVVYPFHFHRPTDPQLATR